MRLLTSNPLKHISEIDNFAALIMTGMQQEPYIPVVSELGLSGSDKAEDSISKCTLEPPEDTWDLAEARIQNKLINYPSQALASEDLGRQRH